MVPHIVIVGLFLTVCSINRQGALVFAQTSAGSTDSYDNNTDTLVLTEESTTLLSDQTATPEPAWCHVCEYESDNEECNVGDDGTPNIVYCDQVQPTCWTQLRFNERGNGWRIESKGCKEVEECYDYLEVEMFSDEFMTCHGGDIPNPGLVCNYCCSRFDMPGCNEDFPWYITVNDPNEWSDDVDDPDSGVATIFVNTLLILAPALFSLL